MKNLSPWGLALSVLVFSLSGCGKGDATSDLSAHDRMKVTLAAIAKDATVNNEYSQTASLEKARAELPGIPENKIGLRVNLLYQMYEAELRLGDEREAVQHIQEARDLLAKHGIAETAEQRRVFLYSLGLGWLRVAETENCIHCRNGESCIFPIGENGRHTDPEASLKAMEYFTELLNDDPDQLTAFWLLNIAAMTVGEYPSGVPNEYRLPESSLQSEAEFPRFKDISEASGLKTVNTGGGSVAEDFDQDGYIDLLTSAWDTAGQLRYFRNKGDGSFEELTAPSGLTGILGGINMVQADYDNDGLVDVYVVRGAWLGKDGRHPNSLLKNLGNNQFRDVTFDVGLDVRHPTATAAWGDYDNDGDLDLYVPNEDSTAQLFRNDNGQFTDVAAQAGVQNNRYAKGTCWGDFDGDRLPDLYVSNTNGNNRLYRNLGNGSFKDVAEELKTTKPNLSFPTWFWDANGDGYLDIYVASYHSHPEHMAAEALGRSFDDEQDCLYLNDGTGKFIESATSFGLTKTTKPMGANFGDLNNDGLPDFYLGTGFPDFAGIMPNMMFVNKSGSRFENVTFPGGFGMLQKGHGISFADFDNDGDQDVFAQTGGAYPGDAFGNVLFENPGFGNHFLRIELVGKTSNRKGVGVRIRAIVDRNGEPHSIYHWVGSGGSFGANPLTPQIGLGPATEVKTLEVFWPTTGKTQTFNNVTADTFVRIWEDKIELETVAIQQVQ
jgi:hypothetical protein